MGQGDLHDENYEHLYETVGARPGREDHAASEHDAATEYETTYVLNLYGSATFVAEYQSTVPFVLSFAVAATFGAVAFVFLMYDLTVQRRNTKVSAAPLAPMLL
jgi:hypothetical protein